MLKSAEVVNLNTLANSLKDELKMTVQFNDRHCYVQDTKPDAVRKIRDKQKPSPILKKYII